MGDLMGVMGIVAMAPPQGGEGGPGGLFGSPFFLIILIAVMFYFLLWRPEKKRRQERDDLLKNLSRGDEVVTSGGIHGRITNLTDKMVTLEVAPNTKIRVGRPFISSVVAKETEGGKDNDKSDKKSKKKY